MDKYSRWVIIILSLQLTISGVVISHLCYKLGEERGKLALMAEWDDGKGVGTHYVK